MVKDDHRPLLGRQPPESPFQLVTNGNRAFWTCGRGSGSIDVELDGGMASISFGGSIAGTHEQAMEPRIESIGIAQPSQILPGSDQGVLHRILRSLIIAKDQAGNGKEATRAARRQRRERVQVTIPGTDYEVALDRITLGFGGKRLPSP